jgi:hypothetical protein
MSPLNSVRICLANNQSYPRLEDCGKLITSPLVEQMFPRCPDMAARHHTAENSLPFCANGCPLGINITTQTPGVHK